MKIQLNHIYVALALLSGSASAARRVKYAGCFGSPTHLKFNRESIYQSIGFCASWCESREYAVMAVTNRTACLCGYHIPPVELEKPDSFCDLPCPGYPRDTCGGRGYFSVFHMEPPEPEQVPTREASTQTIEPVETGSALPTASVGNRPMQFVGSPEL
ncbi:uncharacterized protein F4812DRAFT_457503 [Daldinia caldariorum]|uniref:uncharacterized protein n=1 Tax=Daldinia caldariorum TaxID=326644 RepID=UPI0020080F5D|nr:uncharacterized protein F4812DRAFT_457503 [Daldinia caldariorum]KAI1470109.1 hypothetical protein F4812DRAFT_457503 [Daldinia caldariorum]